MTDRQTYSIYILFFTLDIITFTGNESIYQLLFFFDLEQEFERNDILIAYFHFSHNIIYSILYLKSFLSYSFFSIHKINSRETIFFNHRFLSCNVVPDFCPTKNYFI